MVEDFLRFAVEGVIKAHHAIDQHSKRPDVCLEIVRLSFDLLWRHVLGRAQLCLGVLILLEWLAETKVNYLTEPGLGEHHISRLNVSMDNTVLVALFDGQADLGNVVENLCLSELGHLHLSSAYELV